MDSFYSEDELKSIGLKYVGKEVKVSRKASIYLPERISIGDYSRIDDFCIITGKVEIGRNVHVAAFCGLFAGNEGIYIGDFVGISSRTCIYAISDDYSGNYLSNPTIPDKYRLIEGGSVILKKHSLVGSGCTIMPGVVLGEGTSVGAMSLIKKSTEEWSVYIGIPAKKIKERSKNLLDLEEKYRNGLHR